MANSRNSLSIDTLEQVVGDHLRAWVGSCDHLCVAYSGGLDSSVLLHLAAYWRDQGLFAGLSAVHVHHGLNPAADEWVAHCVAQCQALAVSCQVERVAVDLRSSAGLEAAARGARYAAFDGVRADYLLLAHHRDDQVETLLLNLLRGAAVHGAAAMPAAQGRFLRPLLGIPRSMLVSYAQVHGLAWIEDSSNGDVRYTRNFLRHEILPRLIQRFPAATDRLATATVGFGEARDLLDDLARLDGAEARPLPVAVLRRLAPARAANVLAFHLRQQGVRLPGRRWLGEVLRQLTDAAEDRQVHAVVDGRRLYRFGDALWVVDGPQALPASLLLDLHGNGRELSIPWAEGELRAHRTSGQGIALRAVSGGALRLRVRQGGESLRLHAGGPRRAVKDLLREARVPPWWRERLPMLDCGGRILWVAGVGMDAEFAARPGEDGICLEFDAANW